MKHKKKKILSMLAAIILVIALMPAAAMAKYMCSVTFDWNGGQKGYSYYSEYWTLPIGTILTLPNPTNYTPESDYIGLYGYPPEGYYFTGFDLNGVIYGEGEEAVFNEEEMTLKILWAKYEIIDEAEVTFAVPEDGETAASIGKSNFKVPSGANYSVSSRTFYTEDGTKFNGTFAEGETYKVRIMLEADEGCGFKGGAGAINDDTAVPAVEDRVKFTVNGQDVTENIDAPYMSSYVAAEYTFTAKEAAEDYTVTFKSEDHGTYYDNIIYEVTVNAGESLNDVLTEEEMATIFPDPILEDGIHYEVSYYMNAEDGIGWIFDDPVTKDITLIAGWEGFFNVTFDVNGGTKGGNWIDSMKKSLFMPIFVNYPDEEDIAYAPEGLEFIGIEVDGEITEPNWPVPVTGDSTLKFIWGKIETIDEINVTFTLPKDGDDLYSVDENEYVVPEDGHYSVAARSMYFADGQRFDEYSVFEAGYSYVLRILMEADMGYQFKGGVRDKEGAQPQPVEDRVKYYFNGDDATENIFAPYENKYVASTYKFTVMKTTVGDVNGDGQVDAKDKAILNRYLAGWEGYDEMIADMEAADIDKDGNVNAKDKAILNRYLAGWTGYEQYFETTQTINIR